MNETRATTTTAMNALLVLLDETRDTVLELRDTYSRDYAGQRETFLVAQAITTAHQTLTVLSRFIGKAAGLAEHGRLDELTEHLDNHERFASWRQLHPAIDAASAKAERVIDRTPPDSAVAVAREKRGAH